MNKDYILENLDVVRVCLCDMLKAKKFSELIIENAANHLSDAVSNIVEVDS